MKYKLEKRVLSGLYLLNLRKAEYDKYLYARNIILMAIRIEEAFDVLIDNYLEFETTLLQATNHYLVRFIDAHETFQSERRLFNRKLINLLTTSRAYLDLTDVQLLNYFGKESPQHRKFLGKKALEYDSHLGFRVMEALRNHVQHYGWPIHNVTWSSQLIGDLSNATLIKNARSRFVIELFLNTNLLKENQKFKKKILVELESIKNKDGVNLKWMIREYMEALADIHVGIREIIQEPIKESKESFSNAIGRFQKKYPKVDPYGLELIAENNGKIITVAAILNEFVDSLKILEKKNKNLVNLSTRYVTNEIIEKDNKIK
jgi:hypothetical protein